MRNTTKQFKELIDGNMVYPTTTRVPRVRNHHCPKNDVTVEGPFISYKTSKKVTLDKFYEKSQKAPGAKSKPRLLHE